jgi:ABC-type arginine transport system ATPase subunit
LTLSESKRLHSIRFLGNDALHEMEKPKKEHLYLLLEIVNHLLANLFINDKIIKGKVDTVIDKYEDFLILIQNLINTELINKELTLSELLGKSKRLIEKIKLTEFEKQFEKDISDGNFDYISLVSGKEPKIYKIEKVPEQSIDW